MSASPPAPPSPPSADSPAALASPTTARSALLLTWEALRQPTPAAVAFLRRMNLAEVVLVALRPDGEASHHEARDVRIEVFSASAPMTPRQLLAALRAVHADPAASWLVTSRIEDIAPAATSGLGGVVVLAAGEIADEHGILVRSARELADVPRVLTPRAGGCWHQT